MEIAKEDLEVRLAAELSQQARSLQEQCPGTGTQAPHQKGAQPDCRICRYQLDGIELACASYAKAACQGQVPDPHVC